MRLKLPQKGREQSTINVLIGQFHNDNDNDTISLPLKRHQIEDVKVLWKREIQELMSLKLVSNS